MSIKAFITGITGMVGSHLLDYLIENTDWEIHGLIRWRSPLNNIAHHVNLINQSKRIILHYGDICDYSSLEKIFKNQNLTIFFIWLLKVIQRLLLMLQLIRIKQM